MTCGSVRVDYDIQLERPRDPVLTQDMVWHSVGVGGIRCSKRLHAVLEGVHVDLASSGCVTTETSGIRQRPNHLVAIDRVDARLAGSDIAHDPAMVHVARRADAISLRPELGQPCVHLVGRGSGRWPGGGCREAGRLHGSAAVTGCGSAWV